MEKSYLVVVETDGGERKTIPVEAAHSGEAFQRAKATAGVRRVGRVTEAGSAPAGQSGSGIVSQSGATRQSGPPVPRGVEREPRANERPASGEFTGSGPRVVMAVRTRAVEQPFKHLQPPPERPRPPEAPKKIVVAASAPAVTPPVVAPAVIAPDVSEDHEAEEAVADTVDAGPCDYRITRSRRLGGQPYLLQRGHWHDSKGKRTFKVEWEKGFDDRESAEQHRQWVGQTERELEEVGAEA